MRFLWLFRNPRAIGMMLIAVSVVGFHLSVSDAKEYRRFADATPVTGEVAAIERSASGLKNWRMTIKWSEPGSGARELEVTVRRKDRFNYAVGGKVELLVDAADSSSAILREKLSTSPPMKLAGVDFDPVTFWGAVLASILGLAVFFLAPSPPREIGG